MPPVCLSVYLFFSQNCRAFKHQSCHVSCQHCSECNKRVTDAIASSQSNWNLTIFFFALSIAKFDLNERCALNKSLQLYVAWRSRYHAIMLFWVCFLCSIALKSLTFCTCTWCDQCWSMPKAPKVTQLHYHVMHSHVLKLMIIFFSQLSKF